MKYFLILLIISFQFITINTKGQDIISKLFFSNNIDTCNFILIQDYRNNHNFKEVNNSKYDFFAKSTTTKFDSLKSDSISIIFRDSERMSSYPTFKTTKINLLRYYSDIRQVNNDYNKLLVILMNYPFKSIETNTGRTDTSGVIFGGPHDIITSTGIYFTPEKNSDENSEHNLTLSIDYVLNYKNEFRLKNEYILNLTYRQRRKDCE